MVPWYGHHKEEASLIRSRVKCREQWTIDQGLCLAPFTSPQVQPTIKMVLPASMNTLRQSISQIRLDVVKLTIKITLHTMSEEVQLATRQCEGTRKYNHRVVTSTFYPLLQLVMRLKISCISMLMNKGRNSLRGQSRNGRKVWWGHILPTHHLS